MTTCNKVFLDSCINVEKNQTFLIELNEFIQEALTKVEKDNAEASASKCKTLLNKLFDPIEARMNDCFVVPGGYGLLKPEIDRLKMNYLEVSMNEELGPCKGKVLKDFEDERVCCFFLSFFFSFLLFCLHQTKFICLQLNPALERVLAADQQLSEMKKQEERLRLENQQRAEESKRLVFFVLMKLKSFLFSKHCSK
jgi:hypothetical protein